MHKYVFFGIKVMSSRIPFELSVAGNVAVGCLALTMLIASPARAEATVQRMSVSGFVITGNTLLSQARLMQTLARFTGERSLDELKQAALAVQESYREAGYGAVIAYVPEQSAANGIATIAVLEGRITHVDVSGNTQFSEANILRSVPLLAPGLTPQVQRIDAQIQLANDNPSKQIAVLLEAGAKQGEVTANITVTEAPVQRWTVGLDNTGNAATGHLRANLGYLNSALWDLDHQVALQFQFAPEKPSAVAVVSASYRVPLYAQGMTLNALAAYSNVDGGSTSTAAGPLQFSGKGEVLGLQLTKYLTRLDEVEQRVVLGLDRRAYLNACSVAGLPAGACGTAGASVTVHPLSIEYTAQASGDRPVNASVSLIHNLALGGTHGSDASFDAVRAGANRDYTSLRSNASAGLALPALWRSQVRVAAQLSRDALVSGEQFGLGGANSVRGYQERELLGDSGAFASVEIYAPDLARSVGEAFSSVLVLGFVDAGQVSNRLGTPCNGTSSRCAVWSIGTGLRLGAGPFQFRLDLAQARRSATRTTRSDIGASFQAIYSFY